jgi:hypothetical protein
MQSISPTQAPMDRAMEDGEMNKIFQGRMRSKDQELHSEEGDSEATAAQRAASTPPKQTSTAERLQLGRATTEG